MYVLAFCIGKYSYSAQNSSISLIQNTNKPKAPCGYTVLDAEHIINCYGDTIKYQWNRPKGTPNSKK